MKKIGFITILFLLFLGNILAQNSEIGRVKYFLKEARIFREKKLYGKSEKSAKKALELSKKIRYEEGIEAAEEELAETYYETDEAKALIYYKKLLPKKLSKNNLERVSYYYNVIGLIMMHRGKYSDALVNFRKSLEYGRKIKDYHRMANSANNIGLILNIFGFYDKAIDYFKLSMEYEKKVNNNAYFGSTYINIANSYDYLGKKKEVLRYYKLALKSAEKFNKLYDIALYYNNMGAILLENNRLEKAYEHYKQALKLSEENRFKDLEPYIYNGIGEYFFKKGDFKKALKYQKKAEALNQEDSLRKTIYKDLTEIYLKMKDLKNAEKYHNLYVKCVNKRSKEKIYKEVENLIMSMEKDRLNQKIMLAEKEKKIQKLIIWILVLISSLILIGILILLIKYKYSKKINTILEKLSRKDSLTQLSNRRDIMEKLDFLSKQFKRYGKIFSIVLIDVDNFKDINDTYGHSGGDHILKELSNLLIKNLREIDIVGRWGGDEFILILPETNADKTKTVIKKIKKALENASFSYNNKEIKLTMTFGIYEYKKGENIEEAINKADSAMYEGKKSGKNKIIIFD